MQGKKKKGRRKEGRSWCDGNEDMNTCGNYGNQGANRDHRATGRKVRQTGCWRAHLTHHRATSPLDKVSGHEEPTLGTQGDHREILNACKLGNPITLS